MPSDAAELPAELRRDVQRLWEYHSLNHEPRPCDVGIALGSHDPTVSTVAAELYHQGMYPRLVFTGSNSPTTIERFPQGEANHYRESAIALGVPPEVIMLEPRSTNTGENILFSRELLREAGINVGSVFIISRPYQQRRAYATCRKLWPEVVVVCASSRLSLDEYIHQIGDMNRVVNMLVGDTQRIEEYARCGFTIPKLCPRR
jgi:uncharacterized SAM-binding protein YcdF (DUF218 family)